MCSPAKRVGGLYLLEGSNPSPSASRAAPERGPFLVAGQRDPQYSSDCAHSTYSRFSNAGALTRALTRVQLHERLPVSSRLYPPAQVRVIPHVASHLCRPISRA